MTSRFTATRAGRVFLYLNDAVIGFDFTSGADPGHEPCFYRNNSGTAVVTLEAMPVDSEPGPH